MTGRIVASWGIMDGLGFAVVAQGIDQRNIEVAESRGTRTGVAAVTNLRNGRWTTVRIRDRGRYHTGRLLEQSLGIDQRNSEVAKPRGTQTGKVSVYNLKYRGRKMASGKTFEPNSNAAASRTLPLGTIAAVTNLQNGRSTTVRILDRGPNHAGRILDLSPTSASKLGISPLGMGRVAIRPLSRGSLYRITS